MATMRRRENLTMPDVYSRSQSMSLPQGYSSSKAPVFRRNCSVATSAPSFHEPTMLTTPTQINWMLHQTTSQTPTSSKNCYYSNYEKQSSNKTSFWKIFPALILIFVPWIPCQLTKSELHKRKTEIKGLIAEQKEFVQDLDRYTQTIKEFREGIDRLTKENELSFKELTTGVGKVDLQNEQYLEIEKAEETFVKRIDGLEKHIQIESQKKVTER